MWGSGAGEVTSATPPDRQGGSASSASCDSDDPIPSTVDKGTLSIISLTPLSCQALSNSQPDALPSPGGSFSFRFPMAQMLSLKPGSGPCSEHHSLRGLLGRSQMQTLSSGSHHGKQPYYLVSLSYRDTRSSERLLHGSASRNAAVRESGDGLQNLLGCAPSSEAAPATVVTPLGAAGQGLGAGRPLSWTTVSEGMRGSRKAA